MDILLSEPAVRRYVDQYIDFLINSVVRFKAYCDAKIGVTPQDYADRVDTLEHGYKALVQDAPGTNVSLLRSLCYRLRDLISGSQHTDEVAEACEELLRRFLYNDEVWFRRAYLDGRAARAMQGMYSDHLFAALKTHLDNGKFDAAIGDAFKCLDSHIQKVLKLSPGDRQFGESLINRAFAPDSGPLKLSADPNDQKGPYLSWFPTRRSFNVKSLSAYRR